MRRDAGSLAGRLRAAVPAQRDAVPIGLLAVIVAGLWMYVAAKSATLAITADESLSYTLIHGATGLAGTANDQWLNTWLMRVSQSLFGQAEWALRLPNVLSFGLYGVSGLVIVQSLRSWPARAICFTLLFADPFALEFFSLARGYGISMAFALAALAALLVKSTQPSARSHLGRLACVCASGTAAFYANFSTVNLTVAVVATAFIDTALATVRRTVPVRRREVAGGVAIVGLTVGLMVPGLLHVRDLQNGGQLYYGGHHGFVQDTIGTLVQTWGYVYSYGVPLRAWATTIAWILAAVSLLLLAWAVLDLLRERRVAKLQLAALAFALSIAAAPLEHWIAGGLYPIDRGALAYVLGFATTTGFALDGISGRMRMTRRRLGLSAAVATGVVLAGFNFLRHVNTTRALTWSFDASAREASHWLMALEGDPDVPRPLRFVVPTPRLFAFFYYASLFTSSSLDLVNGSVSTPGGDVYDVPPGESRSHAAGTRYWLTMPEDGTQLWLGPPVRIGLSTHARGPQSDR